VTTRAHLAADLEEARRWVSSDLPEDDVERLFEPVRIGSVVVPNRFVMSAMGTRFADPDGQITDRQIAYYEARARGGVGSIVAEGSSVHPSGTSYANKPRLYDTRLAPGLQRLAGAIRAGGAVAGIQLMHSGRHGSPRVRTGDALSPSGTSSHLQDSGSRAMTEDEIWMLVEAFASAATRANEAGFELLEIHAAHGYLLHDFLSPASNRREDGWGGDGVARARFLVEVIKAVKKAVGDGPAVSARLSCSDFADGGITPDDAALTASLAEQAGADAILISGGNNENIEWMIPPVFMPLGLYLDQAAAIRQRIGIPVGVVGRIATPQIAARAVGEGAADLVFLGRALLADPDYVHKVAGRDTRPIRPCIACNECIAQHIRREPILCTVNPGAGHEGEVASLPARSPRPRRIAVIGGGPSGLLYSSIAAERGNEVFVTERHEIGGKLWLAAAAPYKTREMLALLVSLEQEARAAGVEFRVGESQGGVDADLVVIASGAQPDPGDDLAAEPDASFLLAEDFLALNDPPSWDRVAIIGAGDTACDAAARLGEAASRVWMLARGNRMARGVEPISSRVLRRYLKGLGVEVLFNVEVTAIGVGRVDYLDAEGAAHSLDVDQILYSRGVRATGPTVLSPLEGSSVETAVIGDASEPGNFLSSLRSAWDLATRT
jgi:2,4-dienoyl-CoA reductase-like NADH-dependent reductase (Old Yellow Enzyme family)/thioredoxin reductase